MTKLHRLPTFNDDGEVNVVVEACRGMTSKCKFDPGLGVFVLGKPLPHGLVYPFDWGFIPSTRGEDGDPLDALVIHDAACPVGCVIGCEIIGVLALSQTQKGKPAERNDRFICIPACDKAIRRDVLSARLKEELQQFFSATVLGSGKTLTFEGWKDHKAAARLLHKGRKKR
jgi:inorganic pyrophosphatase